MISVQPVEPSEESPGEALTAVDTPLVHVRRKWIPISTAAWVVAGGIGFALGVVLGIFLQYFGVSGFLSDLANALN